MYMSGSVRNEPGLADGDHRHRAVAAARDDAAALERVEREVDLERRRAPTVSPVARRSPSSGAPMTIRPSIGSCSSAAPIAVAPPSSARLLVRPAEPARPRERRALGRARIASQRHNAARGPGLGRTSGAVWVTAPPHGRAAVSTSSITSPIACSMFPFSITGTPCFRARPTM